jgi:Spy/CpxP family protein refolding chaperone
MIRKHVFSSAALAGLLITAATLIAQGPDPKQIAERQASQLKEELTLTDEQVPKVKEILEASVKETIEARNKYQLEPGEAPSEEARQALGKIRRETNDKMSKVLTAEQMEKYQKFLRERGGFGKGGAKKGKQ